MQITVNAYKVLLGGTQDRHRALTDSIIDIINRKLVHVNCDAIDIYSLRGETNSLKAGVPDKRLIMYFNSTFENESATSHVIKYPTEIALFSRRNHINQLLLPHPDENLVTFKTGDYPIAQFDPETYELNILFDIFNGSNNLSKDIAIFESLMGIVNNYFLELNSIKNSWKRAENKENLIQNIMSSIKESKSLNITEEKYNITRLEAQIKDYASKMATAISNLDKKRYMIEHEQDYINEIGNNVLKDINLIVDMDKVDDLLFNNNVFIIKTKPLYIYDSKGRCFYGGTYTIQINMSETTVNFFGDNPHKSYWTPKDPHPHVNGDNGIACLGNIESTVAELCAQTQLYALATILISFLESANLEDPAGKNVINWEQVDPKTLKPLTQKCGYCKKTLSDANYLAYDSAKVDRNGIYYDFSNEVIVCEDCLNEHYMYIETGDDNDVYLLRE